MELLADIAQLSALIRWKSVGMMESPSQARRYLLKICGATIIDYDDKLIEDVVLALLATFSSDHGNAWKRFDFETMNRLHEHGFISDPVNKKKSIWLAAEGLERGREIADRLFAVRTQAAHASTPDT